ncbi:MAG: UDP-N-acetylmuramoyl-L-alanine--D-glutamate ligase [Candidatus Tectimicrobiota bacterium]
MSMSSVSSSAPLPRPPETWRQRRVTVMGLGSFGGGIGLTRYLVSQGAEVTVTDLQSAEALRSSLEALHGLPIRYVLGHHEERDFVETEAVFVNPAVPLTSRYLALASARQVPLDSEMNLFVRQCRGRVIGITGSVGKTTTTALLGSILQLHDSRTLVGGNIGGSLLDRLPDIGPNTLVVLELSSFQLEQLAWLSYSPPLAIVLNLAPNHLDRHGTMEAYQQAKAGILRYQRPADTAVLNWDDPTVRGMATCGAGQRLYYSMQEALPAGVYRHGDTLVLTAPGQRTVLCQQSDLRIRGAHNLGNAAAAAAAATTLGVTPATIAQGLQRFQALPHRLELVGTRAGVEYYNDSKATTPLSTIRALQAFEQPVILLAGGYDKGTPFDELGRVIHRRARAALVYGKTAPKLAEAIQQAAQEASDGPAPLLLHLPDLPSAVHQASSMAAVGDVVVLSPACASYDQYPHYEARGEHFRTLVQAL